MSCVQFLQLILFSFRFAIRTFFLFIIFFIVFVVVQVYFVKIVVKFVLSLSLNRLVALVYNYAGEKRNNFLRFFFLFTYIHCCVCLLLFLHLFQSPFSSLDFYLLVGLLHRAKRIAFAFYCRFVRSFVRFFFAFLKCISFYSIESGCCDFGHFYKSIGI